MDSEKEEDLYEEKQLDRQTIQPHNPQWEELGTLATRTGERSMRSIVSPLDDRVIGEVPVCQPEDVAFAAAAAHKAQKPWGALPVVQRCRVIDRFKALLLHERQDFLNLVHVENGKSRKDAFEELMDCVLTAGYYGHNAPRLLASHSRHGAIPGLTSTYERHVPKGIVGIISPWNYPLTLAVSDAIPALLAGNAVILKPDSLTPITALALLKLFRQAGLPKDVFQIVTGAGSELGTPIIEASDYIMFTGSTATGKIVARQCAERLIGCSAELGGKNAMLVLADAPIKHTIEGAVQACFSTTGQLCVSIERIYVNQNVYEDFVDGFVEAVNQINLSAESDWEADTGSLISQKQFDTVKSHVDDAIAKGVTVLAGGKARPDLGKYFYEPTVLTDVTDDMILARQETFGPVVSIYKVNSDLEAIEKANDTDYGLNSSVWTSSLAHGRQIAEQLQTGTVNINEGYAAAWASHDAPMGGFKNSGLGRRHGAEGILKYTESQTIAAEKLLLLAPPPFISRESYEKVMVLGGTLLHHFPLELPRALSTGPFKRKRQ